MARGGKRYRKMIDQIEAKKVFGLSAAISFLKENSFCKFDETVEVAINLNADPRTADQNIRGMVPMPSGTGKVVRVAVFARGSAADDALAAGADFVGAEDLADKIAAGDLAFDVCIASPDMMGVVGRLGKILGPKGLMPNPKLGTVTPNVAAAVKNSKAGQVEYRLDKSGIVHAGLCKLSFAKDKIEANIKAFVGAVVKAKPASVKGSYLQSVTVSSTMGIGLRLDTAEVFSF
ncbi:MAG: 50S ribosomal protein L1 [Holosporaceae bacterium]|jgi:large subunit ribosomal protein L1|nr:50S ribosomal protein L1 [Holosporaceae bacterium]